MSILFGLLLARRFYCRSALSLSPGRTGGLLPRINAPKRTHLYSPYKWVRFIIIVILFIMILSDNSLKEVRFANRTVLCDSECLCLICAELGFNICIE